MKKRILIFSTLIAVLFGQTISTVHAQSRYDFAAVDKYLAELKTAETRRTKSTIEPVYQLGKTLAAKSLDDLDSLNETDFNLLNKKMRGFTINREEIIFFEPVNLFFKSLAIKRGTKSDIAFFSLMRQIRPDDVWAAYIEQQTDITGCTIYAGGSLTKPYGNLLRYKSVYPKAYASEIDFELSEIIAQFSDKTCACGSRASVLKEFRLFIKTFPKDKNTPRIKKRLANLEKETDFRFNCQSG